MYSNYNNFIMLFGSITSIYLSFSLHRLFISLAKISLTNPNNNEVSPTAAEDFIIKFSRSYAYTLIFSITVVLFIMSLMLSEII